MKTDGFNKEHYRILLVDDRLGNAAAAGFFQYKLNTIFKVFLKDIKERYGDVYLEFSIIPEQSISNLEYRLKSEPFDLILLDLNFQHDVICFNRQCADIRDINNKTKYCNICKEVYEFAKEDDYRITPAKVYEELGAYWLKYKIRKFNPAIPVVIFTSKFKNSTEMASKYGLDDGFDAEYYEKSKLAVTDPKKDEEVTKENEAFYSLLCKIIAQIRNYETSYHDRIEISKTREENYLSARSRDYTQSFLWHVLTDCISIEIDSRFAMVFLDFDGMKGINEIFGYTNTNNVILQFTKMLKAEIEKTWREVVDNKYNWMPFYRPVLGRFFRERGDEFIIIFPRVIDKEVDNNSDKKGLIAFLEQLRQRINKPEWQKELFSVCDHAGENTSGVKLTFSMGLFVFPDDLSIAGIKRLQNLQKHANTEKEKRDFVSDISEIYSEITRIPQELKDNAKLLGKNQFCYFQKTRKLKGENSIYVTPRINVGIIMPTEEKLDFIRKEDKKAFTDGLIDFLKHISDEIAFDFEIIKENGLKEENEILAKMNSYYHFFIVFFRQKDNLTTILKSNNNLQDLLTFNKCGLIAWPTDDIAALELSTAISHIDNEWIISKMPNLNNLFEQGKWILTKSNQSMHSKMVTNINFLRQARRNFYDSVQELADKNMNEEYYPRFIVQNAIHNKFNDIKQDVVVISKDMATDHDFEADTEEVLAFYRGLHIGQPHNIWLLRRVSNKGGADKFNIIVTIEVNEVAFNFLNMESGRNMVKLQQYFNGFLKGFLANSPDKDLADQLIDLNYEITSDKYRHYKGLQEVILCRNPFFSPVSPNVYNLIAQPARIRLDISITPKASK